MSLQPLLQAPPAIQFHALAAMAAVVLGAVVLWRRKGDRRHRLAGRIWVGLMVTVCVSSFFIHTIRLWGPWSPIHLLSIGTLASLAYAVWMIRRRNVVAHSAAMRTTYVGALVIAGFFTLAPGRIMNHVLFGDGARPAVPASEGQVGAFAIVTHTPLWVWPLLAYVVYVGWRRTSNREVTPARLFILPLVAATLSLYGLLSGSPTPASLAALAAGVSVGAAAGCQLGSRRQATRGPDGMLIVPGDWTPLAVMLFIFLLRYAFGVANALHPELAHGVAMLVLGNLVSGLAAALLVARTVALFPKDARYWRLRPIA